MNPINVFVYGTLLSGFSNHGRLQHPSTKFLGNHTIKGSMYGCGVPIIDVMDEGTIHGELYQISPETLLSLDRLEGYYPGMEHCGYDRVVVKTHSGIETYVYAMTSKEHFSKSTRRDGPRIESGDFRLERENKRNLLYYGYGNSFYNQD